MTEKKTDTPKIVPDWTIIERDYRAGIKPLRQIAEENGITHPAVAKRAKKDGWSRDLNAKIQARADEKVSKAAVTAPVTAETKVAEQQVVEANAELQYQVRMRHRQDIKRLRDAFDALLGELVAECNDPDLFEELGELMRAPDDKGQDKRNDLYVKVMGRSARVDDLKKLTDMYEKVVRMEREAFGIGEEDKGTSSIDELIKKVAAARGGK